MPYTIPRCEVIPIPDHQASFRIDGVERIRWNFGTTYPRPFFYPLIGPSGSPLTRMGHPGASNHDHHQSIWFAHNKVLGIDFWGFSSQAQIRQLEWLAYQDGDREAAMGAKLAWYDGHEPKELLVQELIAIVRPADAGETLLEIQTSFVPTSSTLEFGQTNFGFFAVRVAKGIAAHFGGGQLTSSEGATGEPAVFGKTARWMDYSGHVAAVQNQTRSTVVEGITYFDHASNPSYPSAWHVREDGWMCASPCMQKAIVTSRERPLKLRYLLHAHAGSLNPARANEIADKFNKSPEYIVRKSMQKHQQFEIVEKTADGR
jgi:hypothetical protein